MAFISETGLREFEQSIVPYQEVVPAGFSETFGAAVGLAFDEDLSISSELNREGWQQRKERVQALIQTGEIDPAKWSDAYGRFDYNQFAIDYDSPDIKTSEQLVTERNALLQQRRNYANDVFERGNGLAQFLGTANALMLDPINMATMPFGGGVGVAKASTVAGKALVFARNEAAIAAAAELAIQPMVYQHKMDIESPYSVSDAFTNIAAAAIGAGAIGGMTGGLSAWLKKASSETEIALETGRIREDPAEIYAAIKQFQRMDEKLVDAPEIDLNQVESLYIAELKTRLQDELDNALPRGERKSVAAEIQELQTQRNALQDTVEAITPRKGESKRAAKKRAQKEAGARLKQQQDDIQKQIDELETNLNLSKVGQQAKSELSQLESGVIPERFKNEYNQRIHEAMVKRDVEYLADLESKKAEFGGAWSRPENYDEPEMPPPPPAASNSRQRELLNEQGIAADYDRDIANYEALTVRKVVDNDGNVVDADDVMAELDNTVDGLNDSLVCAIGGGAQ